MKIVHICLCGPFTDGFGYQENILTKYHKRMGHDVSVIASEWIWGVNGKIERLVKSEYFNTDGVKIIRIPTAFGNVENRLKWFPCLYKTIEKEKPDILFIHDCQFLDIICLSKYVRRHPEVAVYVDNHVDYSNGAHGWLSKNVLHKGLWRFCVNRIEPYVTKFYGVLPARVDFLKDLYRLPEKKCNLLVMGADDELVEKSSNPAIRASIRKQYNISDDDFLVITGGKINDHRPETLELMKAVNDLPVKKIKLLIFGIVVDDFKDEFEKYLENRNIIFIGWIDSIKTYEYFLAADLVVFPGLHSVMWEQAVAMGKPAIFKDIEGFHHVDVGGNAIFLDDTSADSIAREITALYEDKTKYNSMKDVAEMKGKEYFSYKRIAKESIGQY